MIQARRREAPPSGVRLRLRRIARRRVYSDRLSAGVDARQEPYSCRPASWPVGPGARPWRPAQADCCEWPRAADGEPRRPLETPARQRGGPATRGRETGWTSTWAPPMARGRNARAHNWLCAPAVAPCCRGYELKFMWPRRAKLISPADQPRRRAYRCLNTESPVKP